MLRLRNETTRYWLVVSLTIFFSSSCNTVTPWDYERNIKQWQEYNGAGYRAFSSGNFAEAIKMHRKAETVSRRFGSEENYLVLSEKQLADAYLATGEISGAQSALETAASVYDRWWRSKGQAYSPFAADSIEVLTGLAGIYEQKGRFAEASSLYDRALEIEDRFSFPTAGVRAEILTSKGNLLRRMGKEEKAARLFKEAEKVQFEQKP